MLSGVAASVATSAVVLTVFGALRRETDDVVLNVMYVLSVVPFVGIAYLAVLVTNRYQLVLAGLFTRRREPEALKVLDDDEAYRKWLDVTVEAGKVRGPDPPMGSDPTFDPQILVASARLPEESWLIARIEWFANLTLFVEQGQERVRSSLAFVVFLLITQVTLLVILTVVTQIHG